MFKKWEGENVECNYNSSRWLGANEHLYECGIYYLLRILCHLAFHFTLWFVFITSYGPTLSHYLVVPWIFVVFSSCRCCNCWLAVFGNEGRASCQIMLLLLLLVCNLLVCKFLFPALFFYMLLLCFVYCIEKKSWSKQVCLCMNPLWYVTLTKHG